MIKTKKGFTLIELLVVIAVIGLLSSIVLVQLGPVRAKARDAKRQSDFTQITNAMEMCKFDAACSGLEDKYLSVAAGADSVTAIGTYMSSVPKDPTDSTPKEYTWLANNAVGDADRVYFCLFTQLEGPSAVTWLTASHQGVITLTQADAPAALATCK